MGNNPSNSYVLSAAAQSVQLGFFFLVFFGVSTVTEGGVGTEEHQLCLGLGTSVDSQT